MLPPGFPAQPGPARDQAILTAIRDGNFGARFADVTSSIPGHQATFKVFADALKIGGVRVTMSAYLLQTVADMLSCTLLTAKLLDLLYAQRTQTIQPHTQPATAQMITTAAMIAQSQWLDSQITGDDGIPQTVGKIWCIDNLFNTNPATSGKAINYGWHFQGTFNGSAWAPSVTLPGVRVIQGRGWAHDAQEVDYSQNCLLVSRACMVDGAPKDILDVFADPELAPLANASGVLKTVRQPGVPQASPIIQPSRPAQASLLPLAIVAAAGALLGVNVAKKDLKL